MARKGRKSKKDASSSLSSSSFLGSSSNKGDVDVDVEYLSESHTIATLNSIGNTSNQTGDSNGGGGGGGGMYYDDADWQLGDEDEMDHKNTSGNQHDDEVAAMELRLSKLLDSLALLDEFASEKRSAKREAMLKQWFKGLTQYASSSEQARDAVFSRRDDIIKACKAALMRGNPAEQYAACRVLEATAVVVGDEYYYEQLKTILQRFAQGTHRAIPVRSAALRAIGMAVFIGVDDDLITESVLDLCETLAQPTYQNIDNPKSLRATALDVWTLLATTIHELYVSGKDDVSIGRGLLLLPLLLQCLEQPDDLSLRSAAGECIAYIHTARLELGYQEDADNKEKDNNDNNHDSDNYNCGTAAPEPSPGSINVTDRKYAQGSWEGSEWEDIMAEIEMQMNELSNQSGHYMSKKAKKEQRATFREYLATVQDNEPPNEVLHFRRGGSFLEFTHWRDVIALNFMRRCLQGGLQIHLLTNPTLQAIFGANGSSLNSSNGGYSQLEKRLILSKTSEANKLKDLDRTKKRRTRNNVKNHFLTVDGDDL